MPKSILIQGDARRLPLADESVDSVVTDPPYGLKFMGKEWDSGVPGIAFWIEALRVAKPGAHLLAFGGTRMYHRLVCAIEDAGWEVRDTIAWVYGSGFPKSLDVSKAIDKAEGAEREVVGHHDIARRNKPENRRGDALDSMCGKGAIRTQEEAARITAPATDAARQWSGWGTALKPAMELICVARKPPIGTVAENVLKHGCGGINVDGCRVETNWENDPSKRGFGYGYNAGKDGHTKYQDRANTYEGGWGDKEEWKPTKNRWPANLIHDGSEEVVGMFPETGTSKATNRGLQHSGRHGGLADIGPNIKEGTDSMRGYDDNGGSAARFFYSAKADKGERQGSKHPTVKPLDLMRYLCRLVTPPGGIVLDPFLGSGTTVRAALEEGFNAIGIEISAEYLEDAKRRTEAVQPMMF